MPTSYYKFVHTELVIRICTHWISTSIYDIKWISSWVFEFEKRNNIKQSLKMIQVHKKNGNVKCNKTITALHFVQYDVLWSTERQYWPWHTALVNIAVQCSIAHHMHSMKCNNCMLYTWFNKIYYKNNEERFININKR